MTQPQIAFLLHTNRSGSTFFAALLAGIEGVGVTIEGGFFAHLIERGFVLREDRDMDRLLRVLEAREDFQAWDLDRAAFRARLAALSRPAGIEAIAGAIIGLYFGSPPPPYVVVKGPRLLRHVEGLRTRFEGAKFLHIVRDPRAVFASQARSRSGLGTPMAADPVRAAVLWRRNAALARKASGPDFLDIRYEDLVRDSETVMRRVLAFLETPGHAPLAYRAGETSAYYAAIPETQKHLHGNLLAGAALADRAEAWRDELDPRDARLTEREAEAEMVRFGYAPLAGPGISARRLLARAVACRARGALMALKRYARILRDRRLLEERLIARLGRMR